MKEHIHTAYRTEYEIHEEHMNHAGFHVPRRGRASINDLFEDIFSTGDTLVLLVGLSAHPIRRTCSIDNRHWKRQP